MLRPIKIQHDTNSWLNGVAKYLSACDHEIIYSGKALPLGSISHFLPRYTSSNDPTAILRDLGFQAKKQDDPTKISQLVIPFSQPKLYVSSRHLAYAEFMQARQREQVEKEFLIQTAKKDLETLQCLTKKSTDPRIVPYMKHEIDHFFSLIPRLEAYPDHSFFAIEQMAKSIKWFIDVLNMPSNRMNITLNDLSLRHSEAIIGRLQKIVQSQIQTADQYQMKTLLGENCTLFEQIKGWQTRLNALTNEHRSQTREPLDTIIDLRFLEEELLNGEKIFAAGFAEIIYLESNTNTEKIHLITQLFDYEIDLKTFNNHIAIA